ncbi:unnamed protein product [Boreogadus saida]
MDRFRASLSARSEEKFRRFLAGLDPTLKAKCLEMGATDLEEALHVAERCENARMTLQRDYIRLGCPPGRLGVEALARTGEPDVRTSPGDVRTSPDDVRTSPGDAACTCCHDSRMLTTAIRETAGSWCRGPNTS